MKSKKKILIAPDKFKFTLDAFQATNAMSNGIENFNNYSVIKLPMADGGEGTSDILSEYVKSEPVYIQVSNPVFKKITAKYYFSVDTKVAFIDLASASGLDLLNKKEQNPMLTSTFGTGEMIRDALLKGAKNIYLGSGGSATTDAALGAAEALGYIFLDKKGKQIKPIGKNLIKVNKILNDSVNPYLSETEVDLLYDVENVFYGHSGAAYVYSKQKGAKKKEIKYLDKGLRHITTIFKKQLDKDVSSLIGGGSAGGFGAGAFAMLNANLVSGSERILKLSKFDQHIEETDIILTGEGKFDEQSFHGKITGKIIEKASKKNIPVLVICGKNEINYKSIPYKNIVAIQALFEKDIDINIAKDISFNMITKTTQQLFKNMKLF